MGNMLDQFRSDLESGQHTILETVELDPRDEHRSDIPSSFRSGKVGSWLTSDPELRGELWRHQAEALRAIAIGRNIVIATGTASGKSLVFQAAAFELLDRKPDSAVVVFYPLKALVADQFASWRRAAIKCGYEEEVVQRVDGDVLPDEREKLINRARILVATPDVIHAWLMRNLARPSHRRFLARLSLIVIDEAHVLESVFGSNFAYLFRRVYTAARFCQREDPPRAIQVIAASATISNPEEHCSALTGLNFSTIGEELDGSPRYRRRLVHVASRAGDEATIADHFHQQLLSGSDKGSFITFIDSRQGAERLALRADADALVKPYRSGYEATDREAIESALRDGGLRGVVSTSALELGINIARFEVGLNLGVPPSRKSFRQRIGRVGRSRPGDFAVIAEASAFRKFGMTFAEYYAASVEPSYRYLSNRFIQYAHARCLSEEMDMLGVMGRKALPPFLAWPDGFRDVLDYSYVGGPAARPREFDQIHRIGGDAPHLGYPLRSVAEEAFIVGSGGGGGHLQRVGTLTLQQAIREAYPGAMYLHLARGWKVKEWRSTSFERTIRVFQSQSRQFTRPLIRTFVNVSIERDGIVEGRFRSSPQGFLAECQLQITQRVEGFTERGERKLYRDLRADDPSMTTKTRDFRTTGVVLRISEPWFSPLKRQVAEALHGILIRQFSVSPTDVEFSASNISLVSNGQRQATTDLIAIYDATHGSLRLTEPLYTRLSEVLDRLARAVDMTPDDMDLLPTDAVEGLRAWAQSLGSDSVDGFLSLSKDATPADGGLFHVYKPGSIVALRDGQGVLRDIEVLEPMFVPIDGTNRLFYRYKAGSGKGLAMAQADAVEPVGEDWSMVLWDPTTGEYPQDNDDLSTPTERPVVVGDSVSVSEE